MMLDLNNRAHKIVKELLGAKSYITVEKLAQKTGVSDKTIRNDLIEINNRLRTIGLGKIVKKRRKGVILEITAQQSLELEQLLEQTDHGLEADRFEERRLFIIRKLLFNERSNLSMQDIADTLYTSRSSVMKWVNEAEDWFNPFQLAIERRKYYGIKLQGTEINWRKAVEEFYWLLSDRAERDRDLTTADQGFFKEAERASALKLMGQILKDLPIDPGKLAGMVDALERSGRVRYTYHSYLRLVFHFALSITRHLQKEMVSFTSEQRRDLWQTREYQLAAELARQLEQLEKIRLEENEVLYITLYQLIGEISVVEDERARAEILNQSGSVEHFLNELTQFTGKTLGVNLKADSHFFNGLLVHLRAAVYRMKFDIRVRNPFLAQIKATYPTMYGLAWGASFLFERHFGVEVNEAEIGFLALYISIAAKRSQEKVLAVVVCNHGLGISQLITESLKRSISDLEIIAVISAQDYSKLERSDFDFVIATVPVPNAEKPVVSVHSILTEKDLERIKRQIQSCQKIRVQNRIAADHPSFLRLYSEDLIFVELEAENKQEVIEFLNRQLQRKGKVHSDFAQSVLERENVTSTAVGQGIAIPHGNAAYVKESCIAVARLKKPLNWAKDEQVDLVFLLAFNAAQGIQKMSRFYRGFAAMLDDAALLASLRESRSPEAIYQFLTSTLNGGEIMDQIEAKDYE